LQLAVDSLKSKPRNNRNRTKHIQPSPTGDESVAAERLDQIDAASAESDQLEKLERINELLSEIMGAVEIFSGVSVDSQVQ
jgi:hypothetical protein